MKNHSNNKHRDISICGPRYLRLIAIQEHIASKTYPNARKLAELVDTSIETVREDIAFLRNRFHHKIDVDNVKGGFYYSAKFRPLPPLQNITEKEILALNLLRNICELLKDLPQAEDALAVLKKVLSTLTKSVDLPKGWQNIVSFHTTARCLFKPEIFDSVFKAALCCDRSKMDYRKQGPAQRYEERVVEFHHISVVNNECYVFAFDVASQKMRTFIPARMKSIESTGKRFKRKKFCIEERLKHSFKIFTGDELHDVLIDFKPEVADLVREKRWGGQKSLRELDNGGVELNLILSSLSEVNWWLLGLGGGGIPSRPIQLLEMMLASGRNIVAECEKRLATLAPVENPQRQP